jgi:hypothetical protein
MVGTIIDIFAHKGMVEKYNLARATKQSCSSKVLLRILPVRIVVKEC